MTICFLLLKKKVFIFKTPRIFPTAPRLNVNKKHYGTVSILHIDSGSMLLSACKYVFRINKYKYLSRMGYLRVYIPEIF